MREEALAPKPKAPQEPVASVPKELEHEQAPREWWIANRSDGGLSAHPIALDYSGYSGAIHVIEHAAYERLERELAESCTQAGNICADMWKAREDRDKLAARCAELEGERDAYMGLLGYGVSSENPPPEVTARNVIADSVALQRDAWREQAEKLAGALRDAIDGHDEREALAAFEKFKKESGG